MKLRPLLLTVAVLAPVSALVWWLGRPEPAAPADARVGQRVADPATLASATRVTIKSGGKTVELARGEGDRWTLVGEPALPADTSRLTRLTGDLVSPKIERLVSSRADKLAAFDLDSAGITYADASGKTLLDLDLGKTLEGGARLLRYDDETKAYAARLNIWLDAEASSWRDTALVSGVQSSDISSISIDFLDTPSPVVISRTKAEDPWTSPSTPAGHQVKAATITSQVGNLSTLRYTNVAPNIDPGVIAARVFSRNVTLTTFSGRTVKIAFARAPEPPKPPQPEVKEGETPPPPPPAEPRPIYVEITDSEPNPVLESAAKTHAFEIAEWVFNALPTKSEELFEPVPAPPSTNDSPSSEAATNTETETKTDSVGEPISVTTPPLTIPADEPGAEAETAAETE
jgi:hypothetical protein